MPELQFLNQLFLAGTVLGTAPIIIHLLNRRRFRIVRWAAMEFLLASLKKNNRRMRLEQLLLLIIRTLILVLLAVVIARPVIKGGGIVALAAARSNRDIIIFFDNSFSMGYEVAGQTVLEQGKVMARAVLDSLHDGDKVSLYVFNSQPIAVVKEPSYDVDSVRAELNATALSDSGTDVPLMLSEAVRLAGRSQGTKQEIYVITDLQKNSWALARLSADTAFLAQLKEVSRAASIFLVDVGAEEPANLAVTDLVGPQRTLVTGDIASFEVNVENFSDADASRVIANFYVDNRKQGTAAVAVAAREKAAVRFSHAFRDEEPHIIRVGIEDDRLPVDDVRRLSVTAQGSIPVLCVDGKPGTSPGSGETRYLEAALAPRVGGAASPIAPRVVSPYSLKAASLAEYRTVILANVSMLTPEMAEALKVYVREGGALVVFLGADADPKFYNERLHGKGEGVLPASLVRIVSSPEDRPEGFFLDPRAFDHPVLSMFEGLRRTPLTSALVSRFYEVALLPEDDNSSVVCRYNVGPPAILEKRYGAGRCLLFTTTCSAEWTNLPKKPVFLPLIHESIYHLAGSSEARRNVLVGEPFRRLLRPDEYAARFSLRRRSAGLQERARGGEGESVTLAGTPLGESFVLAYEDTDFAGVYEVSKQEGEHVEYFCVNTPAEESDVQRVEVEVIRQSLPGFSFTYSRDESGLGLSGERSTEQREVWKVLLWSVLVLVCLESVLAHRFGR